MIRSVYRPAVYRPARGVLGFAFRPNVQVKQYSVARTLARGVAAARRGATFAASTAVVLFGVGIIGVTGYFLTKELILPSSEMQLFHRAFKLVEGDEKSVELLGWPMKAHGEPTTQRNVKTRPIASNRRVDGYGHEHVHMQFHVDGSKNSGVASFESVERDGSPEFRYLVVDVPGHSRHFIINNEASKTRSGGLFGIRWGPKSK